MNDAYPPADPEPAPNQPQSEQPADHAPLQEPRRQHQSRWLPSLVWLIPIVAIVIGISLLVTALMSRGPTVTVTFRTADGLVTGKTRVRYKDVDIGLVKAIDLSEDRSHVIVTIDLIRDAKGFNVTDTRFWVVRPRLALGGISGLDTLLSGAYIGVDIGKSTKSSDEFKGLEVPPVITTDASGVQYVLHADNLGSLDVGTPVFYRRIQVGQVAAYKLDQDGKGITVRIFVNHPFDHLITANTRFWHASGFDVKLDAGGLTVNTQSLVTMLLGGLAFQTPEPEMGAADDKSENAVPPVPAPENTEFALKDNQAQAMKEPEGLAPVMATLRFDQSVRGLKPGAPVDFRGVNVGEVRAIGIEFDRKNHVFNIPVSIELYPGRLGFKQKEIDDERRQHELLKLLVKRGLRAQLKNGNLLTGQMFVALDFFPKTVAADYDLDGAVPRLPTTGGGLDELQTKAESIVDKLDKVPFEDIGNNLKTALARLNDTLTSTQALVNKVNGDIAPEIQATLTDARKTINSVNGVVSSDSPLQQDTRRALQEVTRTATSLRNLTDYLERHPESLIRGKATPP